MASPRAEPGPTWSRDQEPATRQKTHGLAVCRDHAQALVLPSTRARHAVDRIRPMEDREVIPSPFESPRRSFAGNSLDNPHPAFSFVFLPHTSVTKGAKSAVTPLRRLELRRDGTKQTRLFSSRSR
jgi:hypothetical protein